jgi:hypothetical protein
MTAVAVAAIHSRRILRNIHAAEAVIKTAMISTAITVSNGNNNKATTKVATTVQTAEAVLETIHEPTFGRCFWSFGMLPPPAPTILNHE